VFQRRHDAAQFSQSAQPADCRIAGLRPAVQVIKTF